jgi:hypothetical protein
MDLDRVLGCYGKSLNSFISRYLGVRVLRQVSKFFYF